MKTFFCKLIPPRPTFAQDMSESEVKLMREHAAYWKLRMDNGKVVAFGLVGDSSGPYGIAIIEVETDAEADGLTSRDPVILAHRGFKYEIFPMPRGAVYPGAAA